MRRPPTAPTPLQRAELAAREAAWRRVLHACPHRRNGHWVPSAEDPTRMVRCECWERAQRAKKAPLALELPFSGEGRS